VGVRNRFMYLVCRFVVSCRGWLLETSERDRPQVQNVVEGFRLRRPTPNSVWVDVPACGALA